MVAASTSFGYSSVNQFDANRSIMCRQLSSCSSCSSSSNCGRNSIQHQHHHQHQHQFQSTQHQRERSCTRCQSFHRYHHRQRRRSSSLQQMQRSDCFSAIAPGSRSAANVSNTIQAIINIAPSQVSPPPATITSTEADVVASCSSLSGIQTTASVQGKSPSNTPATTPLAILPQPAVTKHCTFALPPTTIPPPPAAHQVSFQATARYHPSTRPKSSSLVLHQTPAVTPTSTNASTRTLTETAALTLATGDNRQQQRSSLSSAGHNVQADEILTVEGEDMDDIVEEASTSSSMSSLD